MYRAFRRQPPVAEPDPAEELKARLAEARAAGDDREEFEAGETPVDEVTGSEAEVEDRRKAVHERGRAAADEMRGSGDGD